MNAVSLRRATLLCESPRTAPRRSAALRSASQRKVLIKAI